LACSAGHGGEGIAVDGHRKPCFFAKQPFEAGQECAAADEHQSPLGDVGGELGRCALEDVLDGVDDLGERPAERRTYLLGVDVGAAQEAADQVATRDLRPLGSVRYWECAADLEL